MGIGLLTESSKRGKLVDFPEQALMQARQHNHIRLVHGDVESPVIRGFRGTSVMNSGISSCIELNAWAFAVILPYACVM